MATSGTAAQRAAAVNLRLAQSAAKFNKEVAEFAKTLVPQQLQLLHKKVALEGLKRIVLKTAVDTGRARGNWQTTVDTAPPDKEVKKAFPAKSDKKAKDANGTQVATDVINKGSAEIAKVQPFSTTYITNNVPYIIWLEDGSSKQAPNGMVKLTIEELRQMFP